MGTRVAPEIEANIRELYASGLSCYRIAEILPVGRTTVLKYAVESRTISEASVLARHASSSLNKDFFRSWSPNLAYLVGLIWTDGYLGVSTRGKQVCLAMREEDLLSRIADAIGVPCKKYKTRDSYICRITMGLHEIVEWFEDLGLHSGKSYSIEWPRGLPANVETGFMRGVIDGDGSFYRSRGRVLFGFVSASETFAREFRDWIASRLDVGGSFFCEKDRYWRFRLGAGDTAKLRACLAPNPCDWHLKRKWKQL